MNVECTSNSASTTNVNEAASGEIVEWLKSRFRTQVASSSGSFGMNSSFVKDLKVDSLNFVDLVMDLEEKFKVRLCETDTQDVQTVGDLVRLILQSQPSAR